MYAQRALSRRVTSIVIKLLNLSRYQKSGSSVKSWRCLPPRASHLVTKRPTHDNDNKDIPSGTLWLTVTVSLSTCVEAHDFHLPQTHRSINSQLTFVSTSCPVPGKERSHHQRVKSLLIYLIEYQPAHMLRLKVQQIKTVESHLKKAQIPRHQSLPLHLCPLPKTTAWLASRPFSHAHSLRKSQI
jgi:hypothetical protein